MDLGGIFSGTFTILKKRWGLMIGIALMPIVGFVVVLLASILLAVVGVLTAVRDGWSSPIPVVSAVVILVLMLAFPLLQYKGLGMVVQATYETAQGVKTSFGAVWHNTKGFVPRSISYYLIMAGIGLAVMAPFVVGLFFILRSINPNDVGSIFAAVVGLFFLSTVLPLILLPVLLWLSIKMIYVIPVIAVERVGGIAAVKRSWALTNGAFWRTFGYYFVGSLAINAVLEVVSLVSNIVLFPLSYQLQTAHTQEQATAALLAMLPLLIVVFLLTLAVSLLTLPTVWIYISCMYLDQVRRDELPPVVRVNPYAPGYGYPPNQYPPNQYPPNQNAPMGAPGYPPPAPNAPMYPIPTTMPGVDDTGAEPMDRPASQP
jgi:hypothetical protein